MPGLVSVIIPTYNRARFLPSALATVAAQDYRPIEAIVIDDGSKDQTPDIIPAQQAAMEKAGVSLVYLRQQNAGPARARNAGLARATGEFVCFLDSDDLWAPTIVSTLHRLLQTHPSAGLAFSAYTCIGPDDEVLGLRPTRLPPEPREGLLSKPFARLMDHMPTNTTCVMVRKAVLDELGVFDTGLYIGEDWDLWYRIAKRYDAAYTLDASLARCRDHPQNMPKHDARGIADRVQLILKHLPDVTDPADHAEQVRRVRADLVLLQEQVMREGRDVNGYRQLLEHELAPGTFRYKVGALVRRQPKWIRTAYAKVVRALGQLQRLPARA